MASDMPEMLDAVFELEGRTVPANYVFALWDELTRILPWLGGEENAGVLPLRGSLMGEELLLPRRARLVLRLPAARSAQAAELAGHMLSLDGCSLRVGNFVPRALQAYPTLHGHLVEGAEDEALFLSHVTGELKAMGVACRWICGMRQTLSSGSTRLSGYSLVLHDLKPEDSLRVQCNGLGGHRRYGCGIFVPHKEISGLD